MAQINFSAYGAVGDGLTNDTAAIQAALNAEGDLIADEGAVFLITSTININQAFPHTINWNNSSIITNGNRNPMILINKRTSNGGLTTFSNLTVDGKGVATRGFTVQSRVNFTNVTMTDFFQPTASSPVGIVLEIYNNVNSTGEYLFDNLLIHKTVAVSNDEITDSWGAANSMIIYWKQLPSNETTININNSTFHSSWGEDAGLLYTLDQTPGLGISDSFNSISVSNSNFYDSERRAIKGFSGNITFTNCTFTDPSPSNPNIQRGTKSGLLALGSEGNNITLDGCTFNSTGYDGRVIFANTSNGKIKNCVFNGGADLAFTVKVGDIYVYNNVFKTDSSIYGYNMSVGYQGTIYISDDNIGPSGYINIPSDVYEIVTNPEPPIDPDPDPKITLTERKAFPTAEGFGKNTTGGRGGSIIEVTNLNASGAGSLRAALTASGARTIIFRVGGTINLAGAVIDIQNPNVTIAGETAPGGGILIQNGGIIVSTSNVIFRHIRFRGSSGGDTIQFSIKGNGSLYAFNIDRIILDHCSFSWANDNTITVVNAKDVTIQKSLMSQVVKSILAWSNKDLSVVQNISAQSQTRMIETNQALGEYLVYEQINNLSYAFNWAVGHGIGMLGTVENEIFERSNSFSPTTRYPIAFTPINPDYILTSNPAEDTYIYHSGNVIDSYFNGVMDPIGNAYLKSSPLYRSTYVPLPTEGLKSKLLTDTGAGALTLQGLDSVDQDVIAHINNKTGTLVTSGTFPTIASGTPYTDSNGDGISDAWATTHGISSATEVKSTYTIDGKTIINDAGYTAREIFFADLAGDFDRLPLDVPVGVPVITLNGSNPMTLQVGQAYVEAGATATNTSNEVVITGTVNTAVAGTYYRYYNVSNEAGPAIQVTRTVIVQEGPAPTQGVKGGVNKGLFWTI